MVARMARVAARTGDPVQPPRMGLSGEAVYDAPGSYVQEK
jgi:hypothetical protein